MAKSPKTLTEAEKKRVEKALARIGMSADMFPTACVDALERASISYEAASLDADRDFYRRQVLTLAAFLLA